MERSCSSKRLVLTSLSCDNHLPRGNRELEEAKRVVGSAVGVLALEEVATRAMTMRIDQGQAILSTLQARDDYPFNWTPMRVKT